MMGATLFAAYYLPGIGAIVLALVAGMVLQEFVGHHRETWYVVAAIAALGSAMLIVPITLYWW